MLHAYKEFWKRYADFDGKSTRSEYWFVYLWNFLIRFAVFSIILICYIMFFLQLPWDSMESGSDLAPSEIFTSGAMTSILAISFLFLLLSGYSVATFIPSLAISVRRLRDAGFPWGLIFLRFVPIVGAIALIILYCQPTVVEADVENVPPLNDPQDK